MHVPPDYGLSESGGIIRRIQLYFRHRALTPEESNA